jgi:hypothetical protein
MRAMVAYPSLRLEPTEHGSRFTLYWIVRGAARHTDGWMTAVGRVNMARALPTTWSLVAAGLLQRDLAELEEAMRGRPGIAVSRFTVTYPDDGAHDDAKEQER